jgi:hypothetical protein
MEHTPPAEHQRQSEASSSANKFFYEQHSGSILDNDTVSEMRNHAENKTYCLIIN